MMELCSRQGTQFLWNGDEKYWRDRAPVLFPYVARLTEGCYTLYGERYSMDIHGFAKDSVFSIEEQSADSVTFCLRPNAGNAAAVSVSLCIPGMLCAARLDGPCDVFRLQ